MKILHISLFSHYTEGLYYQDNLLPEQNAVDGHKVTIICNNTKYVNGTVKKVLESQIVLENGIKIIRIKFKYLINNFITDILSITPRLGKILNEINPDIIMYHGIKGFEIFTIIKYKMKNREVKILFDSHADFHNTANRYLSKYLLHRLIYRVIVKIALKYIETIFYITEETKLFLIKSYNINKNKIKYLPLGGQIINKNIKNEYRTIIRKKLNIGESDILFIHSGKLTNEKKTLEIIRAISKIKCRDIILLIIGYIPVENMQIFSEYLNNDNRIRYLGWKSGDDLLKYICASDVYIQPGRQSATLQNAICCGVPVMVYPHIGYTRILGNSAFYIESENEIIVKMEYLIKNREVLKNMETEIYQIAQKELDYKVIASKMYV